MHQQEHGIVKAANHSRRKGGAYLAGKIIRRWHLGPISFALVGLLALGAFANYVWRDISKSHNLAPAQAPASSFGGGTAAPMPPHAQPTPKPVVVPPAVAQKPPSTTVKQPKEGRSEVAPQAKVETPPAYGASGTSAIEAPVVVRPEDAEAELREAEKKLAQMAAKLAPAGNGPDLIESTIEGEFTGWEGDTIFKLSNGQIWQQATYAYTYHYAFRPKVFIVKTNGAYRMIVEGVSGTIFVKRLQEMDGQITLFDKAGNAVAYLDPGDEMTIYLWSGQPVAYLSGKSVYGFNGLHLGWFSDGSIYDNKGKIVAATTETLPISPRPAPPKGFKRFKPFKAFERFAPFEPFHGITWSDTPTDVFFLQGAK